MMPRFVDRLTTSVSSAVAVVDDLADERDEKQGDASRRCDAVARFAESERHGEHEHDRRRCERG
jgi:hypothetical protein